MILSQTAIFAALAITLSIIRYGTYLWSIYKRETRPHIFTWFNMGTITTIGAFVQYSMNGGPSTWVLAMIGATCYFIAFIAFFVGEKNITKSDWFAFIGALLAIPIWLVTDNPIYALMIVIMIDGLSFYPTIRKSWNDPWGEPPLSYFWGGLRYFLTLFAVNEPTIATLAYPLFLLASDWGFMMYALWRRYALSGTIKQIQK